MDFTDGFPFEAENISDRSFPVIAPDAAKSLTFSIRIALVSRQRTDGQESRLCTSAERAGIFSYTSLQTPEWTSSAARAITRR